MEGIVIHYHCESAEFDTMRLVSFARQNQEIALCFVNSGCSKEARTKLAEVKNLSPENVLVFQADDPGKEYAVQEGISFLNAQTNAEVVGFLGADRFAAMATDDELISESRKSIAEIRDNMIVGIKLKPVARA